MKKLAGVESVEARLNDGKAIIKLKPQNTVRFEEIIQVVRDKAFTPKEARVSARGEVILTGSRPQLRVSGTNEVYDLVGPAAAELKKRPSSPVLLEGVIAAPRDKSYEKIIEVRDAGR